MLQPVLSLYSGHVVKDSFEFVDILGSHSFPSTFYMCLFDVVSLFTNVPLDKTVDICCDAIYRNGNCPLVDVSEQSFRKLILMVTSGVEFSFNDVMFRQIDGVAMGSPLGPVLANIFVGYCESLIPSSSYPPLYCRFMDDSFAYFSSVSQCDEFLLILNDLHPSLKFTCESEKLSKLPFLDVLVEKSSEGGVVTSVYRKPTFTGLYIVWDSFCAMSYKINLVRNLMDRARRLCSSQKLLEELDMLRSLFRLNGYPESVISKFVTVVSPQSKMSLSDVKPVYLRLPWKGELVSCNFQHQVKSAVESSYHDVSVRFVYTTVRAFTVKKDALPTSQQSHVIYQFECRHCESRYVGRTLLHLNARIRQHVPLHLVPVSQRASRPRRGRQPKGDDGRPPRKPPDGQAVYRMTRSSSSGQVAVPDVPEVDVGRVYPSSVANHLVSSDICRSVYSDSSFTVLSHARSFSHLRVLEAIFIYSTRPVLCKQKENVVALKLFVKSHSW